MNKPWMVYIIHFEKKFYHCQHYIGITNDIQKRWRRHNEGYASKLTSAVVKAGISLEFIHVIKRFDSAMEARNHEVSLKKRKESKMFCPVCGRLKRNNKRIFMEVNDGIINA